MQRLLCICTTNTLTSSTYFFPVIRFEIEIIVHLSPVEWTKSPTLFFWNSKVKCQMDKLLRRLRSCPVWQNWYQVSPENIPHKKLLWFTFLLAGLLSFTGGPYSSPEGINKGFSHGFTMMFQDEDSRNGYLPHPEHERVKALIVPLLDDLIAFDYQTAWRKKKNMLQWIG